MDDPTYEEWQRRLFTDVDSGELAWLRIGLWVFPRSDNQSFIHRGSMIHYCRGRFENRGSVAKGYQYAFDQCEYCGERTPEGIKMIALLEKL